MTILEDLKAGRLVVVPPVSVKPLEWDDAGFAASASVQAFGLTYALQNGRDGWFAAVVGRGISEYLKAEMADLDAAKAAAQADYEARVISALAASPNHTTALLSLVEGMERERDEPSFPADGEWLSMEHAERRNTFEDWARTTPLPLRMAESGVGRFYADDRTEWAWQTFAICGGAIAKAEREAIASSRAHQAMTDRWLSAKAEIETLQTWLSGQRERGDFYNDLADKAEARALAAEAERDALREGLEAKKEPPALPKEAGGEV